LILGALASAFSASAQERMPPVPPDTYDAAQKKAAEEFQAARKAPVSGPFSILIRIPELMTANRMMGDYLRLKPSIGTTLSELVILITAREWTQDYEWHVHAPIALKQGISQEIIDAIAAGRRPTGMNEDQEICYDFTIELQRSKRVSDATYARAKALRRNRRFGYRRDQRLLHQPRHDIKHGAFSDSGRRPTLAAFPGVVDTKLPRKWLTCVSPRELDLSNPREDIMPRVIAAVAAIALLLAPLAARAQDWPTRAVTMVVPYAAGGPIDTLARILAARLSEILGQQVVVENVPGAGGMTGSSRVAKAAPDGYTVLLSGSAVPRHQPDPLQEAALQRSDRFRARRAVFRFRARGDRAQGPAGEHACRVRRLRQGQSGQNAVRLRRGGLRHARLRRSAQRRHGHSDHARALSRLGAGHAGSHRRPHRLRRRADLDRAAAD